MDILKHIKQTFHKANNVEKIIYANIALFLITGLFTNFTIEWLTLPTAFNNFLQKPWTLISYAFIHQRLFHLLSNLLVLYYIGNLFLTYYNQKQFLNFYFLGAIVGAVVFLTNYAIFNKYGAPLGGASAAVSTIFVAIATKIPRYALRLRFFGSVELWLLATIWILLSVLQLANHDNGAAIAHLGGAAFGFIYAKQLAQGNDIGQWFEQLLNYFGQFLKPKKSPLKTVYKSPKKRTKKEVSKIKQQKIDAILDKISKSGYESLSQEEKDFLFTAGKN